MDGSRYILYYSSAEVLEIRFGDRSVRGMAHGLEPAATESFPWVPVCILVRRRQLGVGGDSTGAEIRRRGGAIQGDLVCAPALQVCSEG